MAGRPPPAGWYPNGGRMRWWDGKSWTAHVLDQQPVEAPRQAATDTRPTAPALNGPAKDERPIYKKKRFIIPAALIALIIVSSALGDPPEDEPLKVNVAQFIGQTPDDAHNQLEDMLDAEMTTDYDDFSPRGRDVNRYEDIIVAADRKVVTADHPKIRFWTLAPAELKWFDAHPKMPKVKVGSECTDGYGSLFEPIDDLVFTAVKPGAKRSNDATRIKDSYDWATDQTRWPTNWAEPQRVSVGELWESDYDGAVQGQDPKAGTVLKPGQLIVLYCSSPKPEVSTPGDNEVPIPPVPNNDDDDFDFPDRLCPTRFC